MEQAAAAANIQRHIEALLEQLRQEGLLDEQFTQLMQLQDDSNPDFVAEVVELYFEDSASKLTTLDQKLSAEVVDFVAIDGLVHQFKGSSASFGAQTMAQLCVKLREACQRQDRAGCQMLLHQTKEHYMALKTKLEMFMQLEMQRKQLLSGSA